MLYRQSQLTEQTQSSWENRTSCGNLGATDEADNVNNSDREHENDHRLLQQQQSFKPGELGWLYLNLVLVNQPILA